MNNVIKYLEQNSEAQKQIKSFGPAIIKQAFSIFGPVLMFCIVGGIIWLGVRIGLIIHENTKIKDNPAKRKENNKNLSWAIVGIAFLLGLLIFIAAWHAAGYSVEFFGINTD